MNSCILFVVLIGLLSPAVHGFKLRQVTNEDPEGPPPTGPVTCPAGKNGPGGTCECDRAAGWVDGKYCR